MPITLYHYYMPMTLPVWLTQKADKAMYMLLKCVYGCNLHVKDAMFLFDRIQLQMLCYGAEVWCFEHVYVIEYVQLTFCRRILVNSSTNKVILYAELGRHSLSVNYMYTCIKFGYRYVICRPVDTITLAMECCATLIWQEERLGPPK
jgi:hypothetical protein